MFAFLLQALYSCLVVWLLSSASCHQQLNVLDAFARLCLLLKDLHDTVKQEVRTHLCSTRVHRLLVVQIVTLHALHFTLANMTLTCQHATGQH